jgi:uridine kinase
MEEQVTLYFKDGTHYTMKKGTTLYEASFNFQKHHASPIIVAKVGNTLKELCTPVEQDLRQVEWLDLSHKDGMRVYERTASFIMTVAAKKLFPCCNVVIHHHIGGGYFCEFTNCDILSDLNISLLEIGMKELVQQALPIKKSVVPIEEAIELFHAMQMPDKAELFKYRRTSFVNLYELEGMKNYFYGYMAANTSQISCFELFPHDNGFILQFPNEKQPTEIATFKPHPKLSQVFRESEKWAQILNVDTVGALNTEIAQGHLEDLIRISEALHEKKIAQIADAILQREGVKLVLIAGPSSSGKTTFAQRLCIQLRVNGLKPQALSIDDYFVNREFTPKDEKGEYDFESIGAIDTQLFNEHLVALLNGEIVDIPTFNFVKGQREYKGKQLTLKENGILVVEGIHGLNEILTQSVPKESKYKVYVSCLTQLNVDYHNRIPTTDTRLLRRMLRDNQYRGISAESTLALWASVRRGENKNIFPFQEEADSMFNTGLIYELAVLKPKVEPLLFSIGRQSPYYSEAKRLLKFLEYFLAADTPTVPYTSIIREFIGGSCFH